MSDAMFIFCAILLLINGFSIGYEFGCRRAQANAKKESVKPEPASSSADDIEAARKEREALKEQQKAFLDMMGYNADIAYGVNENPLEGG